MMAIVVKNPAVNAGDIKDSGSTLGLGRSPGGGHGHLLQYSCWRIPWTEGSCEMPGWMKHKLESGLPGEISKP